MPVSIIRIDSARKLNGYGSPCYYCEKIILDKEYVARTKTNGTKYYHCFCAMSVNLIGNLGLRMAHTPFKPDRSNRILSRGWRKKIIFFGTPAS